MASGSGTRRINRCGFAFLGHSRSMSAREPRIWVVHGSVPCSRTYAACQSTGAVRCAGGCAVGR